MGLDGMGWDEAFCSNSRCPYKVSETVSNVGFFLSLRHQ